MSGLPMRWDRGPGTVWQVGRCGLRRQPRALLAGALALGLALATAALALQRGSIALPPSAVLAALLGQGDAGAAQVVLQIRLPRVLVALFAGAALGMSGALLQSVARNPLGSPDVVGFTTGAATGAIAQIVLFDRGGIAVALAALAAGLAAALLVSWLAWRGGGGGQRLVLVGIGVGAVLGALNDLMLVKGRLDTAIQANQWLAGSLAARNWGHAAPLLLGVCGLAPPALALAPRLAVLELGDALAAQLGLPVERTRVLAVCTAVMLAALATAAAGPIGFVALAAPQLAARLARGSGPCVFGAAAMGALLLSFADLLAQALPIRASLPVGRMAALLGGMYLVWLLMRGRGA
ncbi:iron chelate uptake ABC transporter family permease subunit [Xanthomonas campestris pv. phormiicola]|nr:iron chelate uptake ABC transporter family permease subunit [Xanthomonas campestris pv. phormiicola]UYC14622.1 iron chelate uptake ABC transporter family permease subunit [Xanthomonas campestris pv. phormiicola]